VAEGKSLVAARNQQWVNPMDSERWRQIDQLLEAAMEREPEERAAFLAAACEGDESLRLEVESLLRTEEAAESFIEKPIVGRVAELIAERQVQALSGQQISHYRIISLLGRGGMGVVYLAEDTRLGRKVALKLLPTRFTQDEDRVRRFVQEAKAASALNHPHIVTIHEIGEDEAGRYIVMELVQGQTLRAMKKPCALDTFFNLSGQIVKALSATHSAGITHRDIKPDNIMAREDGYVKILDFGMARLITATTNAPEVFRLDQNTSPGVLLGTIAYMSPEQARGEAATPATDIFALGIVFYEMTTGRHPFKADTAIDTLHAISSQPPLPPSRLNPEIPAALDALILQMLAKDAGARPTGAEVETALRETERRRDAETQGHIPAPNRRNTVGRERERVELRSGFASARAGRGLLLCVAGEPGIGKTTLVEDFLAELAAEGHCAIARGRCSERLAGAEAYLPLLEALESLLRSRAVPSVARVMKQVAPTWYAQIVPDAGEDEEPAQALDEVKAASQERMKRELGAFFLEVSRLRPLALFFDDMHWADVSTIDMLSYIASRFDVMNALIVVAYRPSDMLLVNHPFLRIKPDLQARGACRELALEFLTRAEIEQYLALEFPGHLFPPELPKLIHAKTEGSPLFMADLAHYLRVRGVIAQSGGAWNLAKALPDFERELPESVRGMIERKIAQLGEEDRNLLTAASAQGYEFDSAVVAQVLGLDDDEVEERLEKLERVNAFVRLVGEEEFPNHALTMRYRFVHALYQNALYAGLRATRRAAMSAAVAQSLLGFHGDQIGRIAAELAALFEAARDFSRAANHYLLAAQHAAGVFAYSESIALARRGLEMLKPLPDSPERVKQELDLQLALGFSLGAGGGWTAPEIARVYHRAQELCKRFGPGMELYSALYGLSFYHLFRTEFRKAHEVSEELLRLAVKDQDSDRIITARFMLGFISVFLGDLLSAAEHFTQGAELYRPGQSIKRYTFFSDPGIGCYSTLSRTLLLLGYPHEAHERIEQAIALARLQSDVRSLGYAIGFNALCCADCNDYPGAQEHSEAVIALARENDFVDDLAWAKILHGHALAMQGRLEEGIAEMREGGAVMRMIGMDMGAPEWLTDLAEALMKAGKFEEALAYIAEALAIVNGAEHRYWESEIYRVKGELLLQSAASDHPSAISEKRIEAEACFQKAAEVARRQQTRFLELRATMSLARLWREQDKTAEARRTLAEIYGWFAENSDTSDLKEAEALLKELEQRDAPPIS
jgi:tetratricopeptide (TPR) repeat protein